MLDHFTGRARPLVSKSPGEIFDLTEQVVSALVYESPPGKVGEELATKGYAHSHWFAILPSCKVPRLLLPLGNTYRMLEGFQIYMPFAPIARVMKALAIRAIEAGWSGRGRRRVLVATEQPLPLERLVTKASGEREPVFALSLGTPGACRKLTLQVMHPDGGILGYIKLPLTEAATERVRHEAATLERLWTFPSLRPYIPNLLHAGEWSDGYILFQSPGPLGRGPIEFGPLHEEFLQTLRSAHQVEKPGHVLVQEVAARWRNADPLLGADWRELGERALARAGGDLEGVMIPCGIMHGDFAPWNTRVGNGRLFVFDWETAVWGAPILWDTFHFHVQVAQSLVKKRRRDLARSRTKEEEASFLLYLLTSLSQYFIEERAPSDHAGVSYRRRLLVDALD